MALDSWNGAATETQPVSVLLGEEGSSGLIKPIWKLFFTSLIRWNYSFFERPERIHLRPAAMGGVAV